MLELRKRQEAALREGRRCVDRYADGTCISSRRQQKADLLTETIADLYPRQSQLEIVDFGCADGAIPVLLLNSPVGERIRRMTGVTLLDYNDLPEKPAYAHPRFRRLIHDIGQPSLVDADLPWGRCDAVLATAFFHYLPHPDIAFLHACRLLKPGGYLVAGMPAPAVLRLRQHGIPGIQPRNRRILRIHTRDEWEALAHECGFSEVSRQAVQWLGLRQTAELERWLRRQPWLAWSGSNHLVIYRKLDESPCKFR